MEAFGIGGGRTARSDRVCGWSGCKIPLWYLRISMGRLKASADEGDIAELLPLKGDVLQNREDTAELRGDMEDLRKDLHAINLKQDAVAQVMTGV